MRYALVVCCGVLGMLMSACAGRAERPGDIYSWPDRPRLPIEQPVRAAAPGELKVTHLGERRVRILNPSDENVVFSVHVKGDTESIGSMTAQMARETYLPPNASLIVEDLVWTTPRMDWVDDRGG